MMDEASIVQPVEKSEPLDVKGGIESTYREFAPLYEHFGVEKNDKADEALSEIWEYCKEQAIDTSKDSILLQVIKFDHELGSGALGEKPYAKMLNYIKVYKQFKASGDLLTKLKK